MAKIIYGDLYLGGKNKMVIWFRVQMIKLFGAMLNFLKLGLKVIMIDRLSRIIIALLGKNFEKDDFSNEEIGTICKIVEGQLSSSGPTLNINGILVPRIGHVFQVKEGTRNRMFPPGCLVLVKEMIIAKSWLENPERMEVSVLKLDSFGKIADSRDYGVRVQDIEPAKDGEKLINDWWNKSVSKRQYFQDGDAVELAEDVVESEQNMQGAIFVRFHKGLKGIIDTPQSKQGSTLDELNATHQREFKEEISLEMVLETSRIEKYLERRCLVVPLTDADQKYDVYIPEYQAHIEFTAAQLKRRAFDKEMFERVVMNEKTREKILSQIYGKEEKLEEWGLSNHYRYGKGKVFLVYGPAGTGKTMTGEAISEKLEKPLYEVNSSSFGSGDIKSFEKGLCDVIEKTNRWNSVTILNEAELILKSRDNQMFDAEAKVDAVLRNLESLNGGILWLTTNRPFVIDSAIKSRIRVQIYFPPLGKEQRKKVWEISIPEKLPVVGLKERLDELAEIPLNGREIRNAVMNAATQASKEGRENVPMEYILKWAKDILESDELLKRTDSEGRMHGPIGFSQKD